MEGIIHIAWAGPFYRYDGIYFEVHRYSGPWPLNKDGDPRRTPPGRGFWRMWDKFQKLTDDEKKKYRSE